MKIDVLKPGDIDTRVFQYGVRVDPEYRDKLHEQLFMAHTMYNDIVAEIKRITTDAIAWLQEKAGQKALDLRLQISELSELYDKLKAADDREGLKKVAEERRGLWREWYELMHAARKEHFAELKSRYLDLIGERTECPIYQIRCSAVDRGLGWATANAALKAAIQAHRKQWPKFKIPNFRKSSEIPRRVLELQFTKKNGIGVDELLESRCPEVSLAVNGGGRRSYGKYSFRDGSGEAKSDITGSVYFHRELPKHSRIKYARLVEQRIGKDRRHYLQFVVTDIQADTEDPTSGRKPLAALDFGWYYEDDGRRIAGIADSADPEAATILRLPSEIDSLLEQGAANKSERDRLRDELVAELKAHVFTDKKDGDKHMRRMDMMMDLTSYEAVRALAYASRRSMGQVIRIFVAEGLQRAGKTAKAKRPRRLADNEKGFTLVEMMIAAVALFLFALATTWLFWPGIQAHRIIYAFDGMRWGLIERTQWRDLPTSTGAANGWGNFSLAEIEQDTRDSFIYVCPTAGSAPKVRTEPVPMSVAAIIRTKVLARDREWCSAVTLVPSGGSYIVECDLSNYDEIFFGARNRPCI